MAKGVTCDREFEDLVGGPRENCTRFRHLGRMGSAVANVLSLDQERDPFGAIVVQRAGILPLVPSERVRISLENQQVVTASVEGPEPTTLGQRCFTLTLEVTGEFPCNFKYSAVGAAGLEPTTPGFGGRYSIQMSYAPRKLDS